MKISTSGGKPTMLYPTGISQELSISSDGKYIGAKAIGAAGKLEFVELPANGGVPVHRMAVSPDASGCKLAADGSGFYYVLRQGDIDNLWFQSFSDARPRQLTHFPSDHIYAYAFSRDGKRIALTRGNSRQDAVMLTNFR